MNSIQLSDTSNARMQPKTFSSDSFYCWIQNEESKECIGIVSVLLYFDDLNTYLLMKIESFFILLNTILIDNMDRQDTNTRLVLLFLGFIILHIYIGLLQYIYLILDDQEYRLELTADNMIL
jgi:hypothetical protein